MDEFFIILALLWLGVLLWIGYDAGKPKERWISIVDDMPEENVDVLVTDGADMWVMAYTNRDADDGSYYYMWEDKNGWTSDICDMTHWMALPEPPKNKYDIS